MNSNNNQDLLLKIAWLYYMEGLTQGEIAQRVSLSRPTIVRMLQQAREEGLIEIRLTRPLPQTTILETELEKTFAAYGLREVIVANVTSEQPKVAVAQAAGNYLQRVLRSNDILGVGWSTTLSYIPVYFTPGQYTPARIVQLVGSVGKMPGANAYEIAIQLGTLLNAPVEHMPAPVIVESAAVREALLRDPTTRRTMEWARQCNLGLVGIGEVSADSTMIQTNYLTAQDLKEVAEKNGVGDILSRYYDINGQEVPTHWQDRIMGLDLAEVSQIDNLIGVAAGVEKSLAVLGALRGGYINTLVVDIPLAQELLAQVKQEKNTEFVQPKRLL